MSKDLKYFQTPSNEVDPYIASVGNNGFVDISSYADGFFDGAMKIFQIIKLNFCYRETVDFDLEKHGLDFTNDTLIYPLCFNFRHAIELYLKGIIEEVIKIYEIKNVKKLDLILNSSINSTHDINILWGYICQINRDPCVISLQKNGSKILECESGQYKFDSRYEDYTHKLDSYINEWGSIDPTSQTFRYPFSKESSKHLVEVQNISMIHLSMNAEIYHTVLKEFYEFVRFDLKQEYTNGSYTKELTKFNLTKLASELPQFSDWGSELTKELKNTLKERYSLPSIKKLDNAIKKIKDSRDLSHIIGIYIDLSCLDRSKLIKIIQFVTEHEKKYPKIENGYECLSFGGRGSTELDEESQKTIQRMIERKPLREELRHFLEQFSYDELIDLYTVYCYGRNIDVNPNRYNNTFEDIKKEFRDKNDVVSELTGIAINNLVRLIPKGCKILCINV